MPMQRLLKTVAFDPEAAELLISAFDAAWNVLRISGSTLGGDDMANITREVLAERIIAMGRRGERDRQCLVTDALIHVANHDVLSRDWPTAANK